MIEAIIEIICTGEGISKEELTKKSRDMELVFARQLIFYFCYELNLGTYRYIGSMAGKDHATVLHSVKVIKNYIDTDKCKAEKIKEYWKTILQYRDKEKSEISIFVIDSTLRKDIELTNSLISDLENKIILAKNRLKELQETINQINN